MFIRTLGIEIESLAATVPAHRQSVLAMAQFPDKKFLNRAIQSTGVEEVRYASANQTASDLCLAAALPLLEHAAKPPGGLVFVSSTPDYLSSATSPILQHKLGLSTSTLCFDLNYGCSGFVYGLFQASLILGAAPDVDSILLLVGETTSKNVDSGDSSTALLFGDAGSACLVRRSQASNAATCFYLQADGGGYQVILKPTGGYRDLHGSSFLHMDGGEVLKFVTGQYQPSLLAFLEQTGVPIANLYRFYFHQANKLILDYLAKKMKIESARVPTSYQKYGNTGAGSVALTMAEDLKGQTAPKDRLSLISGFGVGLSWGHVLVDLSDCRSFGVWECP